MKKTINKIISILLAVSILAASVIALSSCSNNDKLNRMVVGKVGEYDVYYEELRWLTMQYKDLLASSYGKDIWDKKDTAEKYRKELEDAVYASIISNYAILTLCDDEILKLQGEKLIDINGSEVQDIVEQYINETIEEMGSRAAYNISLKENYLTDSLYRFINGVDVCESILFNYYCSLGIIDDSDQAAIEYIYEYFIRTVHVYIQNDSNDSIEENRKLAEAIRVKMVNGEDVNDLISKYSEDRYMASKDGYYFTHGTYSDKYEEASFALDVNEISEVVETYSGFYIIQRLELDGAYIGVHFESDLKDQYLLAVFDNEINACKETLVFIPNEFGSSLDLVNMK